MDLTGKVIKYNREGKEALTELYNALNEGQKKKVMKNKNVESLLIRYGIISKFWRRAEVTE